MTTLLYLNGVSPVTIGDFMLMSTENSESQALSCLLGFMVYQEDPAIFDKLETLQLTKFFMSYINEKSIFSFMKSN